jgi:hypothetical protein
MFKFRIMNKLSASVIAVLLGLLGLASFYTWTTHGADMTSPRIDEIFSETKTICFGRFLVDVPARAQVIFGPTDLPWSITSHPGKGNEIEAVIAERLHEVEEEKKSASGRLIEKDSLVGRVIDGIVPGQKIVFGVSKVSTRIYRIDSFVRTGDDLFIQQADPTAAERDAAVAGMNAIALTLQSRGELEIPDEPGACIEGGFVRGAKIDGVESHSLGIRLAEFSDVQLSISVTKKSRIIASDALEPRLIEAQESATNAGGGGWFSRIKVFRRGSRAIGKWQGFEILARKPAQKHEGESHEFLFVSQGEPKNPLLPLLELEFHSGVKDNQIGGEKPSVSDGEAVALWDKLTGSIRVRPTK